MCARSQTTDLLAALCADAFVRATYSLSEAAPSPSTHVGAGGCEACATRRYTTVLCSKVVPRRVLHQHVPSEDGRFLAQVLLEVSAPAGGTAGLLAVASVRPTPSRLCVSCLSLAHTHVHSSPPPLCSCVSALPCRRQAHLESPERDHEIRRRQLELAVDRAHAAGATAGVIMGDFNFHDEEVPAVRPHACFAFGCCPAFIRR